MKLPKKYYSKYLKVYYIYSTWTTNDCKKNLHQTVYMYMMYITFILIF